MRISRPAMFMDIARVVAKRSTCVRLNVGAIITRDHRIVSIGYNGQAPGEAHCDDRGCPTNREPGKCQTIHAERNAIKFMGAVLPEDRLRFAIYCTDSPCIDCARMIVVNNIGHVFYGTPYRDTSPLDWLSKHCEVHQVNPAGHIIDWVSKKVIF